MTAAGILEVEKKALRKIKRKMKTNKNLKEDYKRQTE